MTGLIRPRRSVLYMPGINERALEKAKTIAADVLILDLEDSVAPESKDEARNLVCSRVEAGGYGNRELIIRTNGLDSPWGADDLCAAASSGASGVLIPKVNDRKDVESAATRMTDAGAPASMQIWAMIETPLAILNAQQIAEASAEANLSCFILGTNDLLKETRAAHVADRYPVLPWLSQAVIAARAYGVDVIDGVYNNFRDEDGLRAECQQGRDLGMDGKTLIHPSQVAPCNEIFSPTVEEVDWARKVIAAFGLPENAGRGVITVDGKMVELLHEAMAQRTVAIADAIAAREPQAA